MKKRILKTVIATMVCSAMLGTTCFASSFDGNLTTAGGGGTTVDGDNDVETPVYKIVVPTTFVFAVDAFEQKGQGQIASEEFTMTNKSNVPVKMDIAVKVTAGAGQTIDFAASAADVKDDDSTKSVYLEALVAETVTETKAAGAKYQEADGTEVSAVKNTEGVYYASNTIADTVEGTTGTAAYPAADAEMEDVASLAVAYPAADAVTFPIGATANKMTFALKGADYIDYYKTATDKEKLFKTTAASNAGSACFRFAGAVNSNVVWAADDFKASAVYTFNGLQTSKYDAITPVPKAQGLITSVSAPTFATGAKGVINFTPGQGTDALGSIVSIKMTNSGTAYDGFNANGSVWSAAVVNNAAGTITFDAKFVAFFTADTEATVTYKTTDDVEKTATVTVKCTN